jgi:hypothetical protein
MHHAVLRFNCHIARGGVLFLSCRALRSPVASSMSRFQQPPAIPTSNASFARMRIPLSGCRRSWRRFGFAPFTSTISLPQCWTSMGWRACLVLRRLPQSRGGTPAGIFRSSSRVLFAVRRRNRRHRRTWLGRLTAKRPHGKKTRLPGYGKTVPRLLAVSWPAA